MRSLLPGGTQKSSSGETQAMSTKPGFGSLFKYRRCCTYITEQVHEIESMKSGSIGVDGTMRYDYAET